MPYRTFWLYELKQHNNILINQIYIEVSFHSFNYLKKWCNKNCKDLHENIKFYMPLLSYKKQYCLSSIQVDWTLLQGIAPMCTVYFILLNCTNVVKNYSEYFSENLLQLCCFLKLWCFYLYILPDIFQFVERCAF